MEDKISNLTDFAFEFCALRSGLMESNTAKLNRQPTELIDGLSGSRESARSIIVTAEH